MKYSKPKNIPALITSMLDCNKGFRRNGRISKAANKNLIAMKSIGEMSFSASLMMANVTPQKIVIEKRAASPMCFFIRNRFERNRLEGY